MAAVGGLPARKLLERAAGMANAPIQWIRSLVFIVNIYTMMLLMGLFFLPWAMFSSRGARFGCRTWCRWTLWTMSWMVGLKTEIRGTPPTDEVLVAAKHQSFLDIILIYGSTPAATFIIKRELRWAPFFGQYTAKLGCIFVDRGRPVAAIRQMVSEVARGLRDPGQLVIYPQGTRVAPGADVPFKPGTAVLYEEMNRDCVPVATNVGLFWPRRQVMRSPGLAVVEFLPRIEAGLEKAAFMERLEREVEGASDRLMREAGFDAAD